MDVQKVGKASLNKMEKKQQVATESVNFTEVMAKKRESALYDKFSKLAKDIEDQGKILSESRTVEDLKKYKKLVKSFMEEAVNNALQLENQRGFNRRGRTKIYKIVKEVDSKLIDLTNEVLNKQKNGLNILNLVGEVQGLLINIYT
ncbi:YaaR family protein [Metabacillus halosaccharovorans]|uniref:YaaR family protein n=1 Tax=Metabacillus halosaccharovorans TaxID=930124 RepID=UPI00203B3072|nr:YaaR family protein [Metabacillus halosaccharovorans]MCM3443759.1 YaaR family protein [Metabacillus halosaccharovorans]